MSILTQQDVTLTPADFKRVSEVIYKHCGINLHDGKEALVASRLSKLIRKTSFNSITEYIDFVLSPSGKNEFTSFVDSLSTNLTSFFREKQHFDYLNSTFLPNLVEKKSKQGKKTIRIWSAGCSSGEEPYSLAICLDEFLSSHPDWDVKILASDVSTNILKKAVAGSYCNEKVTPLNAQQRQKYLTTQKLGDHKVYHTNDKLRSMIRFRYLNLMDEWPFSGPFDAIFCRNVMIYFDKETQERLVNRFFDCLDKGGLLCIGHSESLNGTKHKYKYVMPATYCKA